MNRSNLELLWELPVPRVFNVNWEIQYEYFENSLEYENGCEIVVRTL